MTPIPFALAAQMRPCLRLFAYAYAASGVLAISSLLFQ